ncbi:MAG: hypothetical protein OSB69_11855 [Alphaproteobacteria bacterium]|nr:hypothetical protein [Alphaproteobacteria bacterium]
MGFKIFPRTRTDVMVNAADPSLGSSLMGQRRTANYTTQCFAAMAEDRVESYNPNLILNIISMALACGSNPKYRRSSSMYDSSFERFCKHSQDMLASLNKNGCTILLDEPTGEMAAAGVVVTAEIRTTTSQNIGADSTYLASLDENMVAAVPK